MSNSNLSEISSNGLVLPAYTEAAELNYLDFIKLSAYNPAI